MSNKYTGNGSSLEDCHTNIFSLADLNGLKWKKYTYHYQQHQDKQFTASSTSPKLSQDPILSSYSKCLEASLLCVWKFNSDYDKDPKVKLIHRPKELWIFWHGETPDISDLIDSNLIIGIELGSWEEGLTYEIRTLLFKAFHNIIERYLLLKGFVRLGKWFVEPHLMNETKLNSSMSESEFQPEQPKTQLAFSFSFFLHGESAICASLQVQEFPRVYRLNPDLLVTATIPCTNISQSTFTTTNIKGVENSGKLFGKQNTYNVILCPYGISGILTGNYFKPNDPEISESLEEWNVFYPSSVHYLASSATSTLAATNTENGPNNNNLQYQQERNETRAPCPPLGSTEDNFFQTNPNDVWLYGYRMAEILISGEYLTYYPIGYVLLIETDYREIMDLKDLLNNNSSSTDDSKGGVGDTLRDTEGRNAYSNFCDNSTVPGVAVITTPPESQCIVTTTTTASALLQKTLSPIQALKHLEQTVLASGSSYQSAVAINYNSSTSLANHSLDFFSRQNSHYNKCLDCVSCELAKLLSKNTYKDDQVSIINNLDDGCGGRSKMTFYSSSPLNLGFCLQTSPRLCKCIEKFLQDMLMNDRNFTQYVLNHPCLTLKFPSSPSNGGVNILKSSVSSKRADDKLEFHYLRFRRRRYLSKNGFLHPRTATSSTLSDNKYDNNNALNLYDNEVVKKEDVDCRDEISSCSKLKPSLYYPEVKFPFNINNSVGNNIDGGKKDEEYKATTNKIKATSLITTNQPPPTPPSHQMLITEDPDELAFKYLYYHEQRFLSRMLLRGIKKLKSSYQIKEEAEVTAGSVKSEFFIEGDENDQLNGLNHYSKTGTPSFRNSSQSNINNNDIQQYNNIQLYQQQQHHQQQQQQQQHHQHQQQQHHQQQHHQQQHHMNLHRGEEGPFITNTNVNFPPSSYYQNEPPPSPPQPSCPVGTPIIISETSRIDSSFSCITGGSSAPAGSKFVAAQTSHNNKAQPPPPAAPPPYFDPYEFNDDFGQNSTRRKTSAKSKQQTSSSSSLSQQTSSVTQCNNNITATNSKILQTHLQQQQQSPGLTNYTSTNKIPSPMYYNNNTKECEIMMPSYHNVSDNTLNPHPVEPFNNNYDTKMVATSSSSSTSLISASKHFCLPLNQNLNSNIPAASSNVPPLSTNSTTGIITSTDLSRIFPTPPSLESNNLYSPCGGPGSNLAAALVLPPNQTSSNNSSLPLAVSFSGGGNTASNVSLICSYPTSVLPAQQLQQANTPPTQPKESLATSTIDEINYQKQMKNSNSNSLIGALLEEPIKPDKFTPNLSIPTPYNNASTFNESFSSYYYGNQSSEIIKEEHFYNNNNNNPCYYPPILTPAHSMFPPSSNNYSSPTRFTTNNVSIYATSHQTLFNAPPERNNFQTLSSPFKGTVEDNNNCSSTKNYGLVWLTRKRYERINPFGHKLSNIKDDLFVNFDKPLATGSQLSTTTSLLQQQPSPFSSEFAMLRNEEVSQLTCQSFQDNSNEDLIKLKWKQQSSTNNNNNHHKSNQNINFNSITADTLIQAPKSTMTTTSKVLRYHNQLNNKMVCSLELNLIVGTFVDISATSSFPDLNFTSNITCSCLGGENGGGVKIDPTLYHHPLPNSSLPSFNQNGLPPTGSCSSGNQQMLLNNYNYYYEENDIFYIFTRLYHKFIHSLKHHQLQQQQNYSSTNNNNNIKNNHEVIDTLIMALTNVLQKYSNLYYYTTNNKQSGGFLQQPPSSHIKMEESMLTAVTNKRECICGYNNGHVNRTAACASGLFFEDELETLFNQRTTTTAANKSKIYSKCFPYVIYDMVYTILNTIKRVIRRAGKRGSNLKDVHLPLLTDSDEKLYRNDSRILPSTPFPRLNNLELLKIINHLSGVADPFSSNTLTNFCCTITSKPPPPSLPPPIRSANTRDSDIFFDNDDDHNFEVINEVIGDVRSFLDYCKMFDSVLEEISIPSSPPPSLCLRGVGGSTVNEFGGETQQNQQSTHHAPYTFNNTDNNNISSYLSPYVFFSAHLWPFTYGTTPNPFPNNNDTVNAAKYVRTILRDCIERRNQLAPNFNGPHGTLHKRRIFDCPSNITGPLTWQQFHKLAQRGLVERCEPQPSPLIVVGFEHERALTSPLSINYWDYCNFESYSLSKDIAYVVLVPDNDSLYTISKHFFEYFSSIFELCKLGHLLPLPLYEDENVGDTENNDFTGQKYTPTLSPSTPTNNFIRVKSSSASFNKDIECNIKQQPIKSTQTGTGNSNKHCTSKIPIISNNEQLLPQWIKQLDDVPYLRDYATAYYLALQQLATVLTSKQPLKTSPSEGFCKNLQTPNNNFNTTTSFTSTNTGGTTFINNKSSLLANHLKKATPGGNDSLINQLLSNASSSFNNKHSSQQQQQLINGYHHESGFTQHQPNYNNNNNHHSSYSSTGQQQQQLPPLLPSASMQSYQQQHPYSHHHQSSSYSCTTTTTNNNNNSPHQHPAGNNNQFTAAGSISSSISQQQHNVKVGNICCQSSALQQLSKIMDNPGVPIVLCVINPFTPFYRQSSLPPPKLPPSSSSLKQQRQRGGEDIANYSDQARNNNQPGSDTTNNIVSLFENWVSRCFLHFLESLPDDLTHRITLKFLPVQLFTGAENEEKSVLINLALSIYSSIKYNRPVIGQTINSYTGFGPNTIKNSVIHNYNNKKYHKRNNPNGNGSHKYRSQQTQRKTTTPTTTFNSPAPLPPLVKFYAPPFILAPRDSVLNPNLVNLLSRNTYNFAKKSNYQNTNTGSTRNSNLKNSGAERILYCGYCLDSRQNWLLATFTDDYGSLLQSSMININASDRLNKKRFTLQRASLTKLFNFMIKTYVSISSHSWRLVVSRFGRIGYGEYKVWSEIFSRSRLRKVNASLKQNCQPCSNLTHAAGTLKEEFPRGLPHLTSACLLSTEMNRFFRVFPDSVAPELDRMGYSKFCPLTTPRDVSVTHILVIPLIPFSQSQYKGFSRNDDSANTSMIHRRTPQNTISHNSTISMEDDANLIMMDYNNKFNLTHMNNNNNNNYDNNNNNYHNFITNNNNNNNNEGGAPPLHNFNNNHKNFLNNNNNNNHSSIFPNNNNNTANNVNHFPETSAAPSTTTLTEENLDEEMMLDDDLLLLKAFNDLPIDQFLMMDVDDVINMSSDDINALPSSTNNEDTSSLLTLQQQQHGCSSNNSITFQNQQHINQFENVNNNFQVKKNFENFQVGNSWTSATPNQYATHLFQQDHQQQQQPSPNLLFDNLIQYGYNNNNNNVNQSTMQNVHYSNSQSSAAAAAAIKDTRTSYQESLKRINELQIPLALGYYVSTSPVFSYLPDWFAPAYLLQSFSITGISFLNFSLYINSNSKTFLQDNNKNQSFNESSKSHHPLDSAQHTDVLRFVLEGFNRLSWLVIDPYTKVRTSCLPMHLHVLINLYRLIATLNDDGQ